MKENNYEIQLGNRQRKSSGACCSAHLRILKGGIRAKSPLPTADQLVQLVLKQVSKDLAKLAQSVSNYAKGKSKTEPGLAIEARLAQTASSVKKTTNSATLFSAVAAIRQLMKSDCYLAIFAERFDPQEGQLEWARQNKEAKYQPAIKSLIKELRALRELYEQALPRVLAALVAQHPNVSPGKLLKMAVNEVDEQLAGVLIVLRTWTDGFAQERDGKYKKQLDAVRFAVEQAFRLFVVGDLVADPQERKPLKTKSLKVKDVFLTAFSDSGPSTLPGSEGPIGAHAIQIPYSEQYCTAYNLVEYFHEWFHNFFVDVDGLEKETLSLVANTILQGYKEKRFSFSSRYVSLGENKFPIEETMTKVFIDNLGEIAADVCGGILSVGPAYLLNMIITFAAINSLSEGLLNTRPLLRHTSTFELTPQEDGSHFLEFEAHPPDFIRAFINACALEEIGFAADAEQYRNLTRQAFGSIQPEFIVWENQSRRSKLSIKLAVEDMLQVIPSVVKALLRTKLKSLGDQSFSDLFCWTEARQQKAVLLADNLISGNAAIPEDKGDFQVTDVAAAITLAYWALVDGGLHPMEAIELVDKKGLEMVEAARQNWLKRPSNCKGTDKCEAKVWKPRRKPSATA